jgi:hypothetical protein
MVVVVVVMVVMVVVGQRNLLRYVRFISRN